MSPGAAAQPCRVKIIPPELQILPGKDALESGLAVHDQAGVFYRMRSCANLKGSPGLAVVPVFNSLTGTCVPDGREDLVPQTTGWNLIDLRPVEDLNGHSRIMAAGLQGDIVRLWLVAPDQTGTGWEARTVLEGASHPRWGRGMLDLVDVPGGDIFMALQLRDGVYGYLCRSGETKLLYRIDNESDAAADLQLNRFFSGENLSLCVVALLVKRKGQCRFVVWQAPINQVLPVVMGKDAAAGNWMQVGDRLIQDTFLALLALPGTAQICVFRSGLQTSLQGVPLVDHPIEPAHIRDLVRLVGESPDPRMPPWSLVAIPRDGPWFSMLAHRAGQWFFHEQEGFKPFSELTGACGETLNYLALIDKSALFFDSMDLSLWRYSRDRNSGKGTMTLLAGGIQKKFLVQADSTQQAAGLECQVAEFDEPEGFFSLLKSGNIFPPIDLLEYLGDGKRRYCLNTGTSVVEFCK